MTDKDRLAMGIIERDVAKRRKPVINHALLLSLHPLHRIAELLADGYDYDEIAVLLRYKNRQSVNGQVQKIRRSLGWQAC